jgi:hypothetical protein
MTTTIQRALVAASFLAFVSFGAHAKAKSAKQDAEVQCQDGTTSKAGRGACSHHGGVAKAASAEKTAAAPKAAAESQKEPAEVQCKDGTSSKAGRGACSHHGGVASASAPEAAPDRKTATARETSEEPQSRSTPQGRAAPTAPQRAPPAGQPTARCKDGSLSYSQHRSGTCSRHGGVAEWLRQ